MQRSIRRFLILFAFATACSFSSPPEMLAGDPPKQDEAVRAELQRLVRRLDAAELAERDAAEAELLRRGSAILPLLPPATERTSAEVTQRLNRLRQKLQLAQAADSTEASQITLYSDAMPFLDALASLQDQSGNRIVDHRSQFSQSVTNPTIKLDLDKTPFWQALDQSLDQAGATVYSYSDDHSVRIVAAAANHSVSRTARACYSGPFRFEPIRVLASRELRDGDGTLLRVLVQAAWEPRLHVISLRLPMVRVEAVDDRGDRMPVNDADAQLEVPVSANASSVDLAFSFPLPSREVNAIAGLRGVLMAIMPGKIETFRFAKLADAKGVEQRIAGATVILDEVRKTPTGCEVRMRVRFDDAGDALASHYTWIFQSEALLESRNGKQIAYESYDTTLQKKNEVGVAYTFAAAMPLDTLTFVYKTPGTIVTKEIPFDLHNIALP